MSSQGATVAQAGRKISIVVPAHNEATVIGRCLRALTDGAAPDELEIIVVCNGCSDETAKLARGFAPAVQVIETDVPSKTNAMNLGDQAARVFPRLYVDADVVMDIASVRTLVEALDGEATLAAAPAVETVFPPGAAWAVKAYYAFWMALPYVQEGMMAAGAYAMSEKGRSRFDAFPDIISDDGYVRLQFGPGERIEVAGATSRVSAPGNLTDLIRIKTRSRLGTYQLETRFGELFHREATTKQYTSAFISILRRPNLYVSALPYVWVNLVSRYRARKQRAGLDGYLWERDHSSR